MQAANPSQASNNNNTNSLLRVEVLASPTRLLYGVRNYVQVLVKLITGHIEDNEKTKRPPINLAIVLDRSGSMRSKGKLENAKKAIVRVIENLGPDDRLHVVLYGSDAQVLIEDAPLSENRDALIAKVNAVETAGMTNLWGGVERAAELVTRHQRAGYTRRIFLFSDGLVNAGRITDKKQICDLVADDIYSNKDVRLSAFGLGDDFDEELMKSLAEYGNGSYFFIAGAESIPEFVTLALGGLLRQVGADTVLSLRGVNGGVLRKIYGYEESALVKGVQLDDLRQDNTRSVVLELEVTPPRPPQTENKGEGFEEEILHYELTYKDASTAETQGQLRRHEGGLHVTYTHNGNLVASSEQAAVRVAVVVQQTGEIDAHLISLVDEGKQDEAIAEVERQIELLKSVVEDDNTNLVRGLLTQAEKTLNEMKSEGLTNKSRKQFHHQQYMKRRNSACYFDGYQNVDD